MKCRVCQDELGASFAEASILGDKAQYFECFKCGYVQVGEPLWLDKAYISPINDCDTGIVARNILNRDKVLAVLALINKQSGLVVDFAGGYGLLVRLLRDCGIDALWMDKYCKNILAKGFEYKEGQSDLLVASEVFEHLVDPVPEFQRMLTISPNLLITTNLIPSPTPLPRDWWYYGLEHGQHVGFFRKKTLLYLANRYQLQLITDGSSNHFFSKKKYSKIRWLLLFCVAKFLPVLLRRGLTSRVWSDHIKMIG